MSSREVFLYPKIKCPFCRFFTTAPESLGVHLVDKHQKQVVRGMHKVRVPKRSIRRGRKR